MASGYESMDDGRLTSPTLRRWGTGIAALLVLGGLIGAVAILEQQRSHRQVADTIRFEESLEGTVVSAKVLTPDVTAGQWDSIESHQTIHTVNLSETNSCAVDLREICSMPHLRHLSLSQASWVVDDDLAVLAKAKPLAYVSLDGTSVSFDGFERLRLSRPDLIIQADLETFLPRLERRIGFRPKHYWLNSEADADLLARSLTLPHNWRSGEWDSAPQDRIKTLFLAGPWADAALVKLAPLLPAVHWLSIPAESLSQVDDRLRGQLRTLGLRNVAEASDLGALATMPSLGSLYLWADSPVPSKALGVIAQLPNLSVLRLEGSGFSGNSLASLGNTVSLESLSLVNISMTDSGLEPLSNLSSLTWLGLQTDSPVTSEMLDIILQLPALRRLNLKGRGFSDDTLVPLGNAHSLELFHISDAPITDAGIEPLLGLTHGLNVRFTGTRISDAMRLRIIQHFIRQQPIHQ